MKLLARVEQCGGAGSVRAVLAWWVTPVPRQGCAGIVPSGGTHHWARPKHWESSSTTVPALIIHRSSNLLCQKKPWMRWGGWGLEQKLSVSYIFTLSLHPTEMQHKEVREGGIFHLPGTERPCCCSNLWFIPCMNTSFPSHGRAACEPRCDVLVLWPCPLWPPRSGQDTGMLLWMGLSVKFSIPQPRPALRFQWKSQRSTQRAAQGLPGKWPWQSLTCWLCRLVTPKSLFPGEQAGVHLPFI